MAALKYVPEYRSVETAKLKQRSIIAGLGEQAGKARLEIQLRNRDAGA